VSGHFLVGMTEHGRYRARVTTHISHHLAGRMSKAMKREARFNFSLGRQLPNELEEA
jgi:hypothetical protein